MACQWFSFLGGKNYRHLLTSGLFNVDKDNDNIVRYIYMLLYSNTLPLIYCRWTETEGVKTSIPSFYNTFKDKLRTLPQGADTITWLCLQDADKIESGGFYLDRQPQAKHLPFSGTKYSVEDAQRLLTVLDKIIAQGHKESK